MSFSSATILWFLLLLLIPIILHLVNFRRQRKVYFSDIRLLQNIKSLNQRQQKIAEKLLLVTRILTLLFLILAFAQPFFIKNNSAYKGNYFSVYLDNSQSMSWQDKSNITSFQRAQTQALRLIDQMGAEDRVNILTNSRHPYRWRWLDKYKAEEYLKQIQANGPGIPLADILEKSEEMLNSPEGEDAHLFLFSDFQKSNFDSSNCSSTHRIFAFPIEISKQDNLNFKDLKLQGIAGSGKEVKLAYRLSRAVKASKNGDVKLFINDQSKGSKRFQFKDENVELQDSIDCGSQKQGWNRFMLVCNAGDGLSLDDTAYLTVFLNQNYQVLLAYQTNLDPSLQLVFDPEQEIITESTQISQLGTHLNKNYNLLILNNIKSLNNQDLYQIKSMISKGASCLFFPSENMNISQINNMTSQLGGIEYGESRKGPLQVTQLNSDQQLWKGVFRSKPQNSRLPKAEYYFPIRTLQMSYMENIMEFSNGSPFLLARKSPSGYFVSCASDINPSSSDFSQSPYFLPLLYNLSRSQSNSDAYTFTTDENIVLPISLENTKENVVHMVQGKNDVIANLSFKNGQSALNIAPGLLTTGFWQLKNSKMEDLDNQIAINFSPAESDLEQLTPKEIKSRIDAKLEILNNDNIQQEVLENENSFSFWKLLAIFAIISLLLESYLLYTKKA